MFPVNCTESEYACADGLTCVPDSYRCDYVNDCGDNSDEVEDCVCDTGRGDTGGTEFDCIGGGCINITWVCDGEPDCFDGSDEAANQCGITTEVPTSEAATTMLPGKVRLVSILMPAT